jgi:hypothetical protein
MVLNDFETVFINNIHNKCFNPLNKKIKFNNFDEMDEYLLEARKNIGTLVKKSLPVYETVEVPEDISIDTIAELDEDPIIDEEEGLRASDYEEVDIFAEEPEIVNDVVMTSPSDLLNNFDTVGSIVTPRTDEYPHTEVESIENLLPPISAEEFSDSEEPVANFVPPNIRLSSNSSNNTTNNHTFTIPNVETTISILDSDNTSTNYNNVVIVNQIEEVSGYGFNDDESEILNYGD